MENEIKTSVENMRSFFKSGKTISLEFRIDALKRLKKSINTHYEAIIEALYSDLRKSEQESYLTEIAILQKEIDIHIKKLKRWAKTKRVATPLLLFPSKSRIKKEPYGVVLVIGTWNYPIQLTLMPLIGAISAGNCVMVKTPNQSINCSKILVKIINEAFENNHVSAINNPDSIPEILEQRFDYIFFTGSTNFAKYIMQKASEHLTPLTLELGGKSPAIIDVGVNENIAAKRVVFGKFINAGQTCVAPDYLFVHSSLKNSFKTSLIKYIEQFYGEDAEKSPLYPRIIDQKSFDRLIDLIPQNNVIYGGFSNREQKYISPTILENISLNDKIMQEEIFGPILPIIYFDELKEVIEHINLNEKPLALYYFGKKSNAKTVLKNTSSGGVCINDTIVHLANHKLPFGGVGNSGFGKYHGKYSFETFSHERSILISSRNFDIKLKYPPYKYFSIIKKMF